MLACYGYLATRRSTICAIVNATDSVEGELLHSLTDLIQRNATDIQSIVIELGDSEGASFRADSFGWMPNPRGGDMHDLWRLQKMGYHVYRLNIHVNNEIFDWTGVNVNGRMTNMSTVERRVYVPMRQVRTMRKVEYLTPQPNSSEYPALIGFSQSFLITREQLAEPAKHHKWDLQKASLWSDNEGLGVLNRGNPALANARLS